MVTFHSIVRDGHVPLHIQRWSHSTPQLETVTFHFLLRLFIVIGNNLFCSFDRFKKSFISFVLKNIVHFLSISFVFSLNNQSVRLFVQTNDSFFRKNWSINKKLSFLKSLFQKIVRSVKKLTFFSKFFGKFVLFSRKTIYFSKFHRTILNLSLSMVLDSNNYTYLANQSFSPLLQ